MGNTCNALDHCRGEATFASPDAVMVAATAPAGNEAWIGHPFAEVTAEDSHGAGLSCVPQANAVVVSSSVDRASRRFAPRHEQMIELHG